MSVRVIHGDCLDVLPTLDANSVDAVVTDPPYHLTSIVKRFGKTGSAPAKHGTDGAFARSSRGFMGKTWDGGDIALRLETWAEVYRVLKPGGHMVCFGGTRTSHRMACAIEDAGFEIRDTLAWIYGSGFSKSHDVSKAIDKAAGAVRGRNDQMIYPGGTCAAPPRERCSQQHHRADRGRPDTGPATPEAAQWSGWGSALKPAFEPIILARKPLDGTIAANVLRHGVGGINIDACRVDPGSHVPGGGKSARGNGGVYGDGVAPTNAESHTAGRFPANVLHDGSDEVMAAFAAFGERKGATSNSSTKAGHAGTGYGMADTGTLPGYADTGSAARFFYSAKADAIDRAGSKHPTVKPLDLMRWLVQLITPPGGTVLDPFAGSGTTLLAADRLQFSAIGIEREAEYIADIHRRLRSDAPLFAEVAE